MQVLYGNMLKRNRTFTVNEWTVILTACRAQHWLCALVMQIYYFSPQPFNISLTDQSFAKIGFKIPYGQQNAIHFKP